MHSLKVLLERTSLPSRILKGGEFVADNLAFVLWVYFGLGVIIRYGLSPNIGWFDDAEVALSTIQWSWFYHPNNPPLYHWLLLILYKIIGVHPISHFILKNFLMSLTIYSLFRAGLRVFNDNIIALCLALSPLLIKDWGIWGAFKFTHSNLLVCTMALTFWQITRFIEKPNKINAFWLGWVMALGCLAKYNYVFFIFSCLGGLYLIDRKMITKEIVFLLILPSMILGGLHLWSVFEIHQHYDLTALVGRKFKGNDHSFVLFTLLNQLRMVITQLGEQTFPLNIALGLTLLITHKNLRQPLTPMGRFFLWQQIFAFVSLVGMVLGFGITSQPKRYILPFILGLPWAVFVCIPSISTFRRTIACIFLCFVVAREIWVGWLMVFFYTQPLLEQESVMLPRGDYGALARLIDQEDKTILITEDLVAAGNLRFYLPHMTIYKLGYNDFWLKPKEGKAYNESQIVYLCAKEQCSDKIGPIMTQKSVSLPLKQQEKKYKLMTLK